MLNNAEYNTPVIVKVLPYTVNEDYPKVVKVNAKKKEKINKLLCFGIIIMSLSISCFMLFGINIFTSKEPSLVEYVYDKDSSYIYNDLNVKIDSINDKTIVVDAGINTSKTYTLKLNGTLVSVANTNYKISAVKSNDKINLNIYD